MCMCVYAGGGGGMKGPEYFSLVCKVSARVMHAHARACVCVCVKETGGGGGTLSNKMVLSMMILRA